MEFNNYNFYYPIRFRKKTKNFDNLYIEWKIIETTWGSAKKQEKVIDKYFGNELSDQIKNSKLFSILEYCRFEKAGSNIFHFKKELLELLEKTDVSEIQIGQIKFPFPNFYISLRELSKFLPSDSSKDAIIDGIYVSIIDDSEEDLIYNYHVNFHICGFSESRKEDEFKRNEQDIMELPAGLTFINENFTITDAIAEVHKIMTDTLESKTRSKKAVEREIDYQLEEYNLLKDNLNLMVNCLLYLSSVKPDIETKFVDGLPIHIKNKIEKVNTKHRKEIAEKEALLFGYSKINLVGTSFIKENSNHHITGEIAPHWLRGHWRNQPFGRKLSDTKIIWIKPTIVNKEKGEPQKGHIYTSE